MGAGSCAANTHREKKILGGLTAMRVTVKPLSGGCEGLWPPKKYVSHAFLPASLAKKREKSVDCTGVALKVTPMAARPR